MASESWCHLYFIHFVYNGFYLYFLVYGLERLSLLALFMSPGGHPQSVMVRAIIIHGGVFKNGAIFISSVLFILRSFSTLSLWLREAFLCVLLVILKSL